MYIKLNKSHDDKKGRRHSNLIVFLYKKSCVLQNQLARAWKIKYFSIQIRFFTDQTWLFLILLLNKRITDSSTEIQFRIWVCQPDPKIIRFLNLFFFKVRWNVLWQYKINFCCIWAQTLGYLKQFQGVIFVSEVHTLYQKYCIKINRRWATQDI